jgi:hypothetical protein
VRESDSASERETQRELARVRARDKARARAKARVRESERARARERESSRARGREKSKHDRVAGDRETYKMCCELGSRLLKAAEDARKMSLKPCQENSLARAQARGWPAREVELSST